MKFATSILAIALLAGPALTASSEYKQYEWVPAYLVTYRMSFRLYARRSLSDIDSDFYERGFDDIDDVIVMKEDLDELFSREFVNNIEERSPNFVGILMFASNSSLLFSSPLIPFLFQQ